MCLIFQSTIPPHDKPFTAYKVYYMTDGVLVSPFNGTGKYGRIECPGEYDLSSWYSSFRAYGHDSSLPFGQQNYMKLVSELTEEHVGKEFNVEGFHCLLTKDAAETLREYLRCYTPPPQSKYGAYKTVPVEVDPRDVIAVGDTPIYKDGYDYHYLPTVVTKKLVIKPAAYESAQRA